MNNLQVCEQISLQWSWEISKFTLYIYFKKLKSFDQWLSLLNANIGLDILAFHFSKSFPTLYSISICYSFFNHSFVPKPRSEVNQCFSAKKVFSTKAESHICSVNLLHLLWIVFVRSRPYSRSRSCVTGRQYCASKLDCARTTVHVNIAYVYLHV